jgi:hypothetical protein
MIAYHLESHDDQAESWRDHARYQPAPWHGWTACREAVTPQCWLREDFQIIAEPGSVINASFAARAGSTALRKLIAQTTGDLGKYLRFELGVHVERGFTDAAGSLFPVRVPARMRLSRTCQAYNHCRIPLRKTRVRLGTTLPALGCKQNDGCMTQSNCQAPSFPRSICFAATRFESDSHGSTTPNLQVRSDTWPKLLQVKTAKNCT